MSISYNRRKKAIRRQKAYRLSVLTLWGDTWRYKFNGRKWTLEKVKQLRG